jgi:hypothetical protein
MHRRTAALAPAALAAVWLLLLFAPLVSGRVLATRDVPLFHLPLRAAFRSLVRIGSPGWNPWLHGGQPVLSNPSYAAFYPPSWLVLLVPAPAALSLLTLLHAGLAFAGAWRLARRLGCSPGAAALAAVGWTGCGAVLSLLSAFTLFCGMAWFPWVLAWGDEALRAPGGRSWRRPALLAGIALGLQLLNGEPSTVVMSGLGLLALAASAAGLRPAAAARLPVPVVLAAALAAVQLLPTWGRLADSPRRGGLAAEHAAVWSMPPARVAEVFFPRFFGDPARNTEGLFFGWGLNDRDYPYVLSPYPGLLLAVLGVAALLKWPVPRRAAWAACCGGGLLLALGRHTPVFAVVREAPVFSLLRFPEKFVVLAVAALLVAGVLGWQWLLDERQAGRPQRADFPLAVALVLLATAVTLAVLAQAAPGVVAWFVRTYGAPGLTAGRRAAALAWLRGESWAAVATAAAVVALLALCRWRRPSRRVLEGLAVLLLAADLWRLGHGLVVTLPAQAYREPPPLAAVLLPPRHRIYVEPPPEGAPEVFARTGDPRTALVRASLARLAPYSGVLWSIPYAFHEDYDLMLTGWARRAATLFQAEGARGGRGAASRFLGVWNVGTVLERKTPAEWAAEAARDPRAVPVRAVENPAVLRLHRFVPRVAFHPTHAGAVRAARADGWAVAAREHAVGAGAPGTLAFTIPPRPLSIRDEGGHIHLRYRAEQGAFFVVATTFDPGWRASVDGEPAGLWPTAACQIGVALPPGEHSLTLEYRDRLVPAGAAVSLLALAVCGVLLGRKEKGEEAET